MSNDLKMPEKIVIEKNQDTYGIFSWGPLQKGYAHTLGNALRRVLLSSIQGCAITHIKLPPNVPHEFSSIPGVTEDMTDIVLNLKKVQLKKKVNQPHNTITIQIKKQKQFKASHIQAATSSFEILNPNLVICHVDEEAQLELELTIQEERGYSLAEDHKPQEQIFGQIAIDAIFSPVLNVEIQRKDALVGSRTDYEKLIMKITTDGAKTPEVALREAASILKEHFDLLSIEKVTTNEENSDKIHDINQEIESFHNLIQTPIDKLDLSPRVINSFKAHDINELGDVVTMEISYLMKYRNFGKKSIEEVKRVIESKNLTFGMDIKGYPKRR